ncbi:MAG: hypothetical protein BGO78_05995 [Chloroflexi bacterium 44-23]|nr:MAG: hypothetical protein BGO78_05995 [Chloroflexi bacterium 44-23]
MLPATETLERKKLIVILPEVLSGNIKLARRIFWLAEQESSDVTYLALAEDEERTLQMILRLATMKAVSSPSAFSTHTKVIPKNRVIATLEQLYKPGDLVVCPQELFIKTSFFHAKPISVFLEEELKLPVRTIAGFYQPWRDQTRRWIKFFAFWAGCLLVMALFTLLEVEIDLQLQGTLRTILFVLCLTFEFGALLAWNNMHPIE